MWANSLFDKVWVKILRIHALVTRAFLQDSIFPIALNIVLVLILREFAQVLLGE